MSARRPDAAPIRIMLVDDSAVIRGLINRMITPEPDMEVVASVADGQRAIDQLTKDPSIDVIVLDIEMPVMDGLTALPELIRLKKDVKVVMASTLTLENAEISMKAMELGAIDYVPKPTSTREIGGASDFKQDLLGKVRAVCGRTDVPGPEQSSTSSISAAPKRKLYRDSSVDLRSATGTHRKPQVIAIGSSTGGPQALMEVLKNIPLSHRQPIVITQHMPPTFTTILAKHIKESSGRPCSEGRDGEPMAPGHIYLAPGDFHMTIEARGATNVIRLNQDPPENFCRPAVDPMFRSLAKIFGNRVLSVILTGMGSDGCKGANDIVSAGGTVIAQDEESSVVWGMPGAVATAGLCSAVVPLKQVANYINDFISKGMP